MKEATYYRVLEDTLQCQLCPHYCRIDEGETGRCGVRLRQEKRLLESTFGQVHALAMDPIEKKPLYHFYPGREILSVGMAGCNLDCGFCQNWRLSRGQAKTSNYLLPEELVALARRRNSLGIAYTYSEPSVFYEYVKETARLAHRSGLKNVMVTNGYLNRKPLQELLPLIDAFNLDLKSIENDFYRDYCGGELRPVLNNLQLLAESEAHLEVTSLLIPGLNDSEQELRTLTSWLAELHPSLPLHLSRYYPAHRFSRAPTPVKRMLGAKKIAEEKLDFVYLGNLRGAEHRRSSCPECGQPLIERSPSITIMLEEGLCPACGFQVNISGL